MGCDGGTIPKRDELVRTKKRKEEKDKQAELNFRWRCCTISQDRLKLPIVACGLGRLYTKDSVIMGLLDKSSVPETAKHIKSLKDVKELNLTPNPAYVAEDGKSDGYVDHQKSPFICPLIGLEMNGKFKFCFPWTCGCVVSERAMKELKSKVCQKCQKPFEESDVVILNASGDELDRMTTLMELRQSRLKAEKKAKKAASTSTTIKEELTEIKKEPTEIKKEKGASTSKGKIPEKGSKRPVLTLGIQAKDTKRIKSDYSVAKDPEASAVFKSLFTTSQTAKVQEKAHWITCNPFYN